MSIPIGILNRERVAREAEANKTRAKGYKGKNRWLVIHERWGAAMVFAPEKTSALYTAARYWGADPKRAEFHQSARVQKVRG